MLAGVLRELPSLSDVCFVSARQENLETIHQHNVVAERHGLLGELRQELARGVPAQHQTTLEEWLGMAADATPPPA
jgi:GTP cyclohydrolase IV